MKRTAIIAISIFIMIIGLGMGKVFGMDIEGGSVDTESGSIELVGDVGDGWSVYVASHPSIIEHDGRGRLIVVDSRGRAKTSTRPYVDRSGAYIKLPGGRIDKVVFVDARGKLQGAMGLDREDVANLTRAYALTFGHARRAIALVSELKKEKLSAIRTAGEVFDADMRQSDQIKLFRSAIEMQIGREFADAVATVVSSAARDEVASAAGRDLDGLDPLARGIHLVSEGDNGGFGKEGYVEEGDNGGFGLVAEGDNGGFGKEGWVEEGDNGGFGLVAEGDNGGFGYELLIQGWSIDPDLPELPDMDLNTGGISLFAF